MQRSGGVTGLCGENESTKLKLLKERRRRAGDDEWTLLTRMDSFHPHIIIRLSEVGLATQCPVRGKAFLPFFR